MATVMYIPEKKQSLGAMKGVMDYVCQEKKTRDPVTGQRFVTGVHCLGDNACREFLATKRTYGKTKGVNFYQYVQSFSPKEVVTLKTRTSNTGTACLTRTPTGRSTPWCWPIHPLRGA